MTADGLHRRALTFTKVGRLPRLSLRFVCLSAVFVGVSLGANFSWLPVSAACVACPFPSSEMALLVA